MIRSTQDVVAFLARTARKTETGALPPGYGAFAVAYHAFTLEMLAKLTSGVFHDPVRMSDFVVRFCARYELALNEPPARVTPWRFAFAAAESAPRLTLRNLLLGVSAHMSYDLCAVIVDMLARSSADEIEHDVLAVNCVIDPGIAAVQRALAKRSSHAGLLARIGGGIDDFVTWQTFTRWRREAWHDALAIVSEKTTLSEVEARIGRRARTLALLPL